MTTSEVSQWYVLVAVLPVLVTELGLLCRSYLDSRRKLQDRLGDLERRLAEVERECAPLE